MTRLNRYGRTGGRSALAAAWLFVTAVYAWGATPLGTAFTYQGQLKQNGSPVNDTCDCQFSLWDDPAAGTQVGPTLTFDGQGGNPPPISVSNGLFTLDLDFGGADFNGEARWLQIEVACPTGSPLTPLSPRQPLTVAPYALYALNAHGGAGDGHSLDAADGDPVDVVFVDNAGRVGIGTTAPGRLLDVNGSATVRGSLFFDTPGILEVAHENNTGIRIDPVANSVHLESDNSIGLTLTNLLNVGIGTSNPGAPLHVIQSTGSTPGVMIQGIVDHANPGLRFAEYDDFGAPATADIRINESNADALELLTGGIARMAIQQSTGNVGIGTTTPTAKLHVEGSEDYVLRARSMATSGFKVGVHGQTLSANGGAGVYGETTGGGAGVNGSALSVAVSGTGVQGYANGASGIGVWGLAGDFSGTNFAVRGETLSPNGYAGYFEGGRNYFEGKVGIGTQLPSEQLEVFGNIRASGNITATGAVAASCGILSCSDARFKTNVRPVRGALDKVEKLNAVLYDWRHEAFPDHRFGEDRQVGLIAQEVKEILPEIVHEGSDGYLAVDYGRLTPLLVEAVKELKHSVEERDAQLTVLRAEKDEQMGVLKVEIADLTARLERMEAMMAQLTEATSGGAE